MGPPPSPPKPASSLFVPASVPEHSVSVLQVSSSVVSYLRPGAHQGPPGALRTNQLSPISSGGFLLFSTWILLGVSLLLLDNLSRNVHAEVSTPPSSPVLPDPPSSCQS